MRCREERIAKHIVARSQIVKKCHVNGDTCDLHIEESTFIQDGDYTCSELEQDIDGFMGDVNRELSRFGLNCDRPCIRFCVNNDLLVFTYDQSIAVDDAMMEMIRTSEWIIEE